MFAQRRIDFAYEFLPDRLREIIAFSNKPTRGVVIFEADPRCLVTACLKALNPA